MPRKSPWPPRIYPRDGKEYIRIRTGPKKVRELVLGPVGSPEARTEYQRICAEILAHGETFRRDPGITVAEMVVQYLRAAQAEPSPQHHRQRPSFHRVRP